MPIYVVLSKFTEQGRRDIQHTSDRLDRLAPVADKLGVKVLANAITMGQYDVVTVMEAADDTTIAKVIGTVLSRGYVTTQTMRGFSIEEFRKITADIYRETPSPSGRGGTAIVKLHAHGRLRSPLATR